MLTNVDSSIFSSSKSIKLTPAIFAEWNQNIFNAPYATVAGEGILETDIEPNTLSLVDVTGSQAKPGFDTKKYTMTDDEEDISYTVTPVEESSAFKIITYFKTNKNNPIMANISAQGAFGQFGSSSIEINSFGWTKVETYIGGESPTDTISEFTYRVVLNRFSTEDDLPEVIFTVPEVYAVSYFDYQYNSVWPSDSIFTNFRPGESYVNTGSSKFSFPTDFRKISQSLIDGYTDDVYMPISPIIQNPSFINVAAPVPLYKNGLLNDMSPYKYFVSDTTNRSVTGLYDKDGIILNKLVIKFNTLMSTPIINILIDGTAISVDGSTSINLSANIAKEDGGIREESGVLVLYWSGTEWTRSRWSNMPSFNSDGSISKITTLNKITVTQTSQTIRSSFSTYTSDLFDSDILRMQVIEVSPRVELDLTNYVTSFSVNKSLDGKDTYLPISSINADDASVTLSGIPLGNISSPVQIFSNQSNNAATKLRGMLRKNIKFYTNFYLENYFNDTTKSFVTPEELIPAGVFYSDTWEESDINEVSVQLYDNGRYLQSTQVADYVSNLRTVIDVISNMLDLSGFTDYDYDSLYTVCHDQNMPLDLAYFYVNSKDTTLVDALDQIFLPYQIGAYIDEYGVMKFLSLSDILGNTEADINISETDIVEDGYTVVNKAKPGKISLRYQSPKIKQTLALQNLLLEGTSPSFIYTTSNDVLWSQQNSDSVGMNYLNQSMNDTQNYFMLDENDPLDIFHTYNLNTNGYAAIENEIVSFVYKQYSLEDQSNNTVLVNVKNDIELAGEIDRFNKKYKVGLQTSDGTTKSEYNTVISPTGKITNVQRGMFGTKVSDHTVLSPTNAATKNISCKNLSSSYNITGNGTTTTLNNQFDAVTQNTGKTLFYPTTERSSVTTDTGIDYYRTYSAKFNLVDNLQRSSGGVFFNLAHTETSANDAFFVELVKYNTKDSSNNWNSPAKYNYALAFYRVNGNNASTMYYSDVTAVVNNIINNFEKVLVKSGTGTETTYTPTVDARYASFNLRVSTYKSTGDDGENNSVTNLFSVFLNNREISGWKQYSNNAWVPLDINENTGLPKRISFSHNISSGSIFGSFISTDPVAIAGITYPSQVGIAAGGVREIYATYKPLIERSVNYYFQDREFLNGMIQNQNIFSKSKSYIMQTKPEVIGINTYDIQYTTPAAVSANVLPVEYLLQYFPGTEVVDQKYLQKKEVDEYSLSYSTILNTGFRAKFAIANNTSHMVFLKKEPTDLMPVSVVLNLWTQEIIAPSDPEIIEKITDPTNLSESVQLDSVWIQSKESANKLVNTIAKGIDNFSKDVSLQIFGNPLIQVGDVVEVSYNLPGLNQQKYLVHSISHSFDSGLSTSISLNMIDSGVDY
jgi:predicted NAD-dependent protein-ADP-ribosyltransferase YbiA (DUF1768 family)